MPKYNFHFQKKLLTFFLSVLFVSCSGPTIVSQETKPSASEKRDRMIAQNRAVLEAERIDIQLFIDSTNFSFQNNGLGMQIARIEQGQGVVLDTGDRANIHSRITGLDGYEYSRSIFSEFTVLRDNKMIWGVQEASLGSKRGDSLILIIPAHLAHGLAGDLNTIPPLTPLVYYLRIL
ncbi:MAG: Uncharacterised protein [Owenweeksia sp. TMED14]|nr:MAG: Uncharacterised protein [Owenweeksia sp. TMED14]|tara:strand:- start:281 stop:811 length:531 start_codon:yes stop_codon:yes gene_type:complete